MWGGIISIFTGLWARRSGIPFSAGNISLLQNAQVQSEASLVCNSTLVQVSFSGVARSKRKADHSPSSNVPSMSEWREYRNPHLYSVLHNVSIKTIIKKNSACTDRHTLFRDSNKKNISFQDQLAKGRGRAGNNSTSYLGEFL